MSLPPDTEKTLEFDRFKNSYNYSTEFRYNIPFFRIVKTLVLQRQEPVTVLDIGCGEGIGRNKEMQREIRKVAGQYWGVEPDTEVATDDNLFDRVEHALLEDAALPENSVDVAYAFMVMEHVQDPEAFLRRLGELLKPGGVFVFASPNAKHMFGRIAYWSNRLHVDSFLLGLVLSKDTTDHHYPLAYKINTAQQIRQHAQAAGLNASVAYCESPSGLQSYFKGPLKLIRWGLITKRKWWKQPKSLCHIYGYIQKPLDDSAGPA